jgi:hypothetical protein
MRTADVTTPETPRAYGDYFRHEGDQRECRVEFNWAATQFYKIGVDVGVPQWGERYVEFAFEITVPQAFKRGYTPDNFASLAGQNEDHIDELVADIRRFAPKGADVEAIEKAIDEYLG